MQELDSAAEEMEAKLNLAVKQLQDQPSLASVSGGYGAAWW